MKINIKLQIRCNVVNYRNGYSENDIKYILEINSDKWNITELMRMESIRPNVANKTCSFKLITGEEFKGIKYEDIITEVKLDSRTFKKPEL